MLPAQPAQVIRTSAKTGENVSELFQTIAEEGAAARVTVKLKEANRGVR